MAKAMMPEEAVVGVFGWMSVSSVAVGALRPMVVMRVHLEMMAVVAVVEVE
jgi:hypothetical protein